MQNRVIKHKWPLCVLVDVQNNELIRPTIENGFVVIVLLIGQFILQFLPGTDILVIEPNITVATVLYSLLTLIIFGFIIRYSTAVGTVLSENVDNIPNLDTIIQITAVIITTLWAYTTFWWIPYFQENQSLYSLLFLVIGLLLLSWLGYLLYSAREGITDIVMNEGNQVIAETRGDNESVEEEEYES